MLVRTNPFPIRTDLSKAIRRLTERPHTDSESIRNALGFIPSDDRDLWVRMALAIKAELDEKGFQIWLEWSRPCESFNERDAINTWKNIRPTGAITIRTLFHEAKKYGWTPPKSAPAINLQRPKAAADRSIRDDEAAEKERLQAAANAVAIWDVARAAGRDHPYLLRKGVEPLDTFREIDTSVCASMLGYTNFRRESAVRSLTCHAHHSGQRLV